MDIVADSLILFSVPGGKESPEEIYFHSAFVHELQGKLLSKEPLPFELRALEAVMVSVISALQSELTTLRPEVESLLDSIDRNPDGEFLRNLLVVRRRLNKFVQKVDAIRATINHLLHSYLSDKAAGRERAISDHMDAELMFEHYLNMADEIASVASNLASNVQSTQQMLAIVLDTQRNRLIVYDLKANLATMAISSAALVAGLFGMNLPNALDNYGTQAFALVSGSAVMLAVLMFLLTLRRISMLKSVKGKTLLKRLLD
ncbi:magnesium ion transporter [Phlyctochytrium bullatum]|nr:magnesium ion transporter [Phlyctochytrium bullatum]